MLNMIIRVDDDAAGIPFPDRPQDLPRFVGGDQIVQTAKRSVAVPSQLGIRMERIIEQLILETDGGPRRLFLRRQTDKVFYAAVGAGGQLEIELQIECTVFAHGHDISANATFSTL